MHPLAPLVFVFLFLCSCDWLWPDDAPFDPGRCSGTCPPGKVCHNGGCAAICPARCLVGCDIGPCVSLDFNLPPLDAGTDSLGDAPPADLTPSPPMFGPTVFAVGAGGSQGSAIAVDSLGKIYIAGSYTGNNTIKGATLPAPSGLFVARLTSNYSPYWVEVASSTSQQVAVHDITVVHNGNSYITGTFNGTTSFGTTTLSAAHDTPFVAKLGPKGSYAWAIDVPTTASSEGRGIGEYKGNAYITGTFSGTATFGTTVLTAAGDDVFVAMVDTDGKFVWASSAGGAGTDTGQDIAVDSSSGYIRIVATYEGPVVIDVKTTLPTPSGVFVAMVTAGGDFGWVTPASALKTKFSSGASIAVDNKGRTFVAGNYQNPFNLGTFSEQAPLSMNDIFVAMLDSAGKPVWVSTAQGIPGSSGIQVGDLAVDTWGNCYITGTLNSLGNFGKTGLKVPVATSAAYLTRLDSTGNFEWALSSHVGKDTGTGQGLGVATNFDGMNTWVFTTGDVSGSPSFGASIPTTVNNAKMFIAPLKLSN